MELNKIYNIDCIDGLNRLPPKCANLVIADPPYYRVKGDFDFRWETFDDYMNDCERWATACERVLADNGTLLWYGDHRRIAHIQVMLEKLPLNFLNNGVIYKTNDQKVFVRPEKRRSFYPNTERFLLFESARCDKTDNKTLLKRNEYRFAQGMCFQRCMIPLVDYFNEALQASGMSVKEVNEAIGTKSVASHFFTRGSQWHLPTAENYKKLQEAINPKCGKLKRPYEELKKQYEELRRPFDTHGERLNDVLKIATNVTRTSKIEHPTVKDWRMTSKFIEIMTRPDDLVVVPFAGSGTECACAYALHRDFVGFEIDKKYQELATTRVKNTLKQVL